MNPIMTAIVAPSIAAGIVGFLLTYAGCCCYNYRVTRGNRRGTIRNTVIPIAWLLAAMLIIGGAFGVGMARADDPMTDAEWAYAQAFGRDAICATLDDYPTEAGVYGVATGIHEDGFTPEAVAHIVNYSVSTWCPRYWPLLERMGRRARHEMPA